MILYKIIIRFWRRCYLRLYYLHSSDFSLGDGRVFLLDADRRDSYPEGRFAMSAIWWLRFHQPPQRLHLVVTRGQSECGSQLYALIMCKKNEFIITIVPIDGLTAAVFSRDFTARRTGRKSTRKARSHHPPRLHRRFQDRPADRSF